MEQENKIKAYKGFNSDMTCRNFQFEVGKEYEQEGKIEACEKGFHACENPMGVFGYYPPSNSRYCEVEQSGSIDRGQDKIASSKIRIQCEIGLSGIIQAGVKFILDKVNWKNDNHHQHWRLLRRHQHWRLLRSDQHWQPLRSDQHWQPLRSDQHWQLLRSES
nr:MAG TPA: hypothetical protein [Caudoviricetes sp.]